MYLRLCKLFLPVTNVCQRKKKKKCISQSRISCQFVDEPIENVVNDIFRLNIYFWENIECENDVFTTGPKTMLDISIYLHDEEADDNESNKNEEQVTVPSFH